MAEPVHIGIIGAGRIGQVHARNLCTAVDGAKVTAVTDVVIESARRCAAECGIPNAPPDYRHILESPDIDAIVICTPTDTHARLIVEAARAGKHIFCEKPISFDLEAIDRALEEVGKAGVKLQIGFNRRFDPGFRDARQKVAEGKIGTPHLIRITSRDPEPPPVSYIKSSGGLFMDMTIHDFDMSRFLAGEEIREVYAAGANLVDPAIEAAGDIDTAVITLTYRSGAFCVIDNSRQAVYGYDQRVEVFGSEGCVIVGNRQPHDSVHYSRGGMAGPPPLYFFMERYTESFREEMRRFVSAIREDAEPAVTGRDGKMPVVIARAAMQSLQTRTPVSIDARSA